MSPGLLSLRSSSAGEGFSRGSFPARLHQLLPRDEQWQLWSGRDGTGQPLEPLLVNWAFGKSLIRQQSRTEAAADVGGQKHLETK